MHAALVSRLLKDRSAWELAHVPVASSRPARKIVADAAMNEVVSPALLGV